MAFRLKMTAVFAATAAAAAVVSGCGGGAAQTKSATGTTGTAPSGAAVREGFNAFIAAARAGGRTGLADRFAAAIASGDHTGFGLFQVPSPAMAPAMLKGDRVVGEHIAATGPRRGDIVVFVLTPAARISCGARTPTAREMKRVIGLPGDHVELVSNRGDVLINGTPYIVKGASPNLLSNAKRVYDVPQGKLFVLGDNRRASCDSAIWTDPYVPKANVQWKLAGIYFPATHAGLFT